jgi:mannonate dehydratase
MLGDKIKVQSRVSSDYTDDQLLLIRQMGIQNVYVIFRDQDTDYDSVMKFVDRLHKFDLTVNDAGNVSIYKSDKIHLGLPGRDEAIERYNNFNKILARAGIPIGYMTWEPNQVLTTKFAVGKYTRGGVGRIVDIDELKTHPYTHGRLYTKDEMWENFKYFLDRVLPVCEDIGLKIALHPNDPPVDCLVGISNLITSAEDYKHAFELAGNSPYLGMKMCIGCWLEGAEHFGNVLNDIKYFVENKKVLCVHFRNISSPLPKFEETLLEDGYMNMYHVMKQFVQSDYDGGIHVDHVPVWCASVGGQDTAWVYSTGYMKALLNCAKEEVNK